MDVIKTIKPGEPGSRRFIGKYGDDLVNVRYRKAPSGDTIYTTIEIIVDRRQYAPNINHRTVNSLRNKEAVAVTIAYQETELRQQAKSEGALWSRKQKVWVMWYSQAVKLGIANRIVANLAEECTDIELYG